MALNKLVLSHLHLLNQIYFVDCAPATQNITFTPYCYSNFLLLVPVAINSMIQPAGRVWGPGWSRYQVYLRCIPLVCVVDTLLNVGHIIGYYITYKKGLQHAVLLRMSSRNTESLNQEPNSLGNVEDIPVYARRLSLQTDYTVGNAWDRYLWFILGPLPASIMLFSTYGTFQTTVYAVIFLATWVVNELLFVIATAPTNTGTLQR